MKNSIVAKSWSEICEIANKGLRANPGFISRSYMDYASDVIVAQSMEEAIAFASDNLHQSPMISRENGEFIIRRSFSQGQWQGQWTGRPNWDTYPSEVWRYLGREAGGVFPRVTVQEWQAAFAACSLQAAKECEEHAREEQEWYETGWAAAEAAEAAKEADLARQAFADSQVANAAYEAEKARLIARAMRA